MKILILTNNGEGLYKFRKELIVELVKCNDVFISLPEDRYIDRLIKLGCSYIKTEFNRKGTNPIKDYKLYKFYLETINKVMPDAVLTYTIKPSVYGGLASSKLDIPYIVNITGLGSAIENGGVLSKIALFLYRLGIKNANKVFFQNEVNMAYMISKKITTKESSILLPGSGVNIGEYKFLEYKKKGTIDFAFIGRIMKEKGIEQYLEAAAIIKKSNKNVIFHIAGEFEEDYKEQIESLERRDVIKFHGSVDNMIDEIYSICDCIIHPTYYAEGLSNVLLEASACGRAIITTNRPGCREVIDDNNNGYIVKEKNTEDLVNKINKYISLSNDERIQMGINGRMKVEKEFDRRIVVSNYIKVIEKLER